MQIFFSKKTNNKGMKTKKKERTLWEKFVRFVSSVFIGVCNGFFGGGGGMVAVPFLQKGCKLDTKSSHATALVIIFPLCVVSLVVYGLNNSFDFENGWWVCGGAILGGIVGAVLLRKLKGNWVSLIFAIIMLSAGIRLVI